MTTPKRLGEMLREAARFDENAAHEELTKVKDGILWRTDWSLDHISGRRAENARLQLLIYAAAECVDALEREAEWLSLRGFLPVPESTAAPLTKLRALLAKGKS